MFSISVGSRCRSIIFPFFAWLGFPALALARPGEPPAKSAPRASAELSEIEASIASDHAATAPVEHSPVPHGGGSAQTMNPDLSLIADFALAAFSDGAHRQTGGHDPSENGFNLQQLELSLGSAVDPYFRFDANVVFGLEEVEVEEAYATTLALGSRLQARTGQFLSRFGRLNPTHLHDWNFVDQPFPLGRVFGGEGNRGLGLELSYLTPLPWYVELVASATLSRGEGAARSFYPEEHRVEDPGDLLYVAALKQFFALSPDWSLAFGLSVALAPNAHGDRREAVVYGGDAYLKYRPISEPATGELGLATEWLCRVRDLPEGRLMDAGGYLELVVKFARRYAAGARYEIGTPSYDRDWNVASDPLDPEWTQARARTSAALTYTPSEFSRFRLQGSRDAAGSEIWAAFLSAEFVTGAHHAHAF
jgi:hypothetical protein